MSRTETMEPMPREWMRDWQAPSVPQWVGIVSIVIGILGLLCWGGSAAMNVAASSMQGMVEGAPQPSPAHRVFESAGYIAGVVLGIWLIAAGSGIAAGRLWGRGATRTWAIIRLVVAAIGIAGALYWLDEVVAASKFALDQQAAQAAEGGASAADSPELTSAALSAITLAFICMQTVAVSIWPTVVLIVTRRRASV